MDKNIYEPSPTFNFSELYLANPAPVQGGSYFTKLLIGDKNNLYLQLPRCKTKNGIIKSGKKYYCDLLFSHNQDTTLIQWLESLENTCRELINQKKNLWFQNAEDTDLESMLTSIMRLYKSGAYVLVRVFLPYTAVKNNESSPKCLIVDENETIKEIEDVTNECEIIPLVCINGIKFTSKDFKIEIHLTQVMLLDNEPDINLNCRIKHPSTIVQKDENESLDKMDEEEQINNIEHLEKTPESDVSNETVNNALDISTINEPNVTETISNESVTINDNSNLDKTDSLEEVNLDYDKAKDEEISLKKPSEVYIEIYKAARSKAKHLKAAALEAYLDANAIKSKYMLNDLDIDSSDDEDFEPEAESLAES